MVLLISFIIITTGSAGVQCCLLQYFAGGLPALLRRSELLQQVNTPEPGNRDLMGEGKQCGGVQEGSPEEYQGPLIVY